MFEVFKQLVLLAIVIITTIAFPPLGILIAFIWWRKNRADLRKGG